MKALLTVLTVFALFLVGQSRAAEPAKGGMPKAATTAEQLLSGMPKSAWPKGAKDGVPERTTAENWMKKNLVGKRVEWSVTVGDVKIEKEGDKFKVTVTTGDAVYSGNQCHGVKPFPDTKSFGEITKLLFRPVQSFGDNRYVFKGITTAEAKTLRDMKGKKVSLQTSVNSFACVFVGIATAADAKPGEEARPGEPTIVITAFMNPPFFDGFVPSSLRQFYK